MRALSLNERRLIEVIATKGPIARTDLGQLLDLTGATVTRNIAGLEELELFDEYPDRQGAGGQPKRLLKLRSGRYFSAGLTFSRKNIELAILDLAGHIVDRTIVHIQNQPALAVAKAASRALDGLLLQNNIAKSDLLGMGCAMPVNFGLNGYTVTAHGVFNELEDPETLKAFLSTFGIPILLENDGKTSAIGEHMYGRQQHDGSLIYLLHIAHGVGGGAVMEGAPFYGATGNACLPGFLYPLDGPRPSGVDLIQTLTHAGYNVEDFTDIEPLVGECSELDGWIERAGAQLAQAVLAVSAILNPSIIVVGGRMPHVINQKLVDVIRANSGTVPSRGLSLAPIRASALGPGGGALGAACLPFFESFFRRQELAFVRRFGL